jgi:hypothetical protein
MHPISGFLNTMELDKQNRNMRSGGTNDCTSAPEAGRWAGPSNELCNATLQFPHLAKQYIIP